MEFEEKIKSKNWKERQEAYIQLGEHFADDKYLGLIEIMQNETNIPALETAIDSILKSKNISTCQVSKIFLQIGNNKVSLRNRIYKLIEQINDADLMPSLVPLLNNKNPKIVYNISAVITDKLKNNNANVIQELLESLNFLLGHSESNVRNEAMKLTIECFRKIGNELKQYLSVKQILMKELEEEFVKIQPNEILTATEIDFSKLDDPKWSIRLETLTQILNTTKCENINELLYKRINDPNNQVFFLLLDIIMKHKIKSQKIINGLIDRLKDKKVVVTNKIKEVLIFLRIDNFDRNFFTVKSPELKYNLIEVCQKCNINDEQTIKCIIKCTNDSNSQVRKVALEALRILNFDRSLLDSELVKKINKMCNSQQTSTANSMSDNNNMGVITCDGIRSISDNNNVNGEDSNDDTGNNDASNNDASNNDASNNDTCKKYFNTHGIKNNAHGIKNNTHDIKNNTYGIKNYNTRNNTYNTKSSGLLPDQSHTKYNKQTETNFISKSTVEQFYEKYKFLADTKWSVRLEGIKSITDEFIRVDLLDFCKFIYSVKDANFQVNILYFNILLMRNKEIYENYAAQEIIIAFCIDKITDVKLRSTILSVLDILNRNFVIENIINEVVKTKKGKKFVDLIKALTEYQRGENEVERVFKCDVTGMQEKNAVRELKKKFEEMKQSIYTQVSENDNTKTHESVSRADEIFRTHESVIDDTHKSVIDDTHESVIHDTYKPVSNIPNLLSKRDTIFISNLVGSHEILEYSDDVIDLYINENVQSTFFNSLLLYLISKKHILSEDKCNSLVSHFISNGYFDELQMIDRIYPMTKLFLVLKKVLEERQLLNADKLIVKFIMKYVDQEKKQSEPEFYEYIKNKITNSKDFLDFIDSSNKSKDDNQEQALQFSTRIFSTPKKNKYESIVSANNEKVATAVYNQDLNINKHKDYREHIYDKHKDYREHIYDKEKDYREHICDNEVGNHDQLPETSKSSHVYNKTSEQLLAPLVYDKCTTQPNINTKLIAPLVHDEIDFNFDIETSLDCLNISQNLNLTPNKKKFRKEFYSPRKNIDNLECILDNLIDSDQEKSKTAFESLLKLITKDINFVLFSANSIVSSISIQLLDVARRPEYSKLVLSVLLKLSQSKIFCEQVRKETLESVNIDLINLLQNDMLSDTVSDILTNICLNSKMSVIFEVYLKFIENKSLKNDIPLKLLWRHSKSLDMNNAEELQKLIQVLEEFFTRCLYNDILENSTTFKICILHLREICIFYQDRITRFNLGRLVHNIIIKIMTDQELNIHVLRSKVRGN